MCCAAGSAAFVIAPDEVHVWLAAVPDDRAPSTLPDTLSDDERARASRFVRPIDRRRFVRARDSLRRVLERYTGVPAAALRFTPSSAGKPSLAHEAALRFSVSHPPGGIAIALGREREVGIDLEPVRHVPEAPRILRELFPRRVGEAWVALPPAARDDAFIAWWTCLEAYGKAVGSGLLRPLPLDIEVLAAVSEGAEHPLAITDDDRGRRYAVAGLACPRPYRGAVAAEGTDWRLSVRRGW